MRLLIILLNKSNQIIFLIPKLLINFHQLELKINRLRAKKLRLLMDKLMTIQNLEKLLWMLVLFFSNRQIKHLHLEILVKNFLIKPNQLL